MVNGIIKEDEEIFGGPSPVTRDPTGKLSTGFSPLGEGKEVPEVSEETTGDFFAEEKTDIGTSTTGEPIKAFIPKKDDAVVDIEEEKKVEEPKIELTRLGLTDILSKAEGKRSEAEKETIRKFKARRALGETSQQIFGEGKEEVKGGLADEGIRDFAERLIRGDKTLQDKGLAPGQEFNDERVRRVLGDSFGLSESEIDRIIQQRDLSKQEERIKSTGQEAIGKKQTELDLRLEEEIRQAKQRGQERQATLDRSLSFSGFGRSSVAVEKRDELQKSINAEIAIAEAKVAAEAALFKAQQEGADGETIASLRRGVAGQTARLKEAETKNAIDLAKANQELGLKADEALDAFLNGTTQGIEAKEKGFDEDASLALGYISDKFGNPLVSGDDGNPIAFTGNDLGSEVKISNFKDGNDNTFVYKNGQLDSIIQNDGTILTGEQVKTIRVPEEVKADQTAQAQRDNETDLRKEFNKEIRRFKEIRSNFQRVEAGVNADSAAGDLALIFSFMKMLDPGSVVREGEFATAQNATGIDERVRNLYNRVNTGERLGEKQRKDFLGRAEDLFEKETEDAAIIRDQFVRIADDAGARSDFITGAFDDIADISGGGQRFEFIDRDEDAEIEGAFKGEIGTTPTKTGFKTAGGIEIDFDALDEDFKTGETTSGTNIEISKIGSGNITQSFGATSDLKIDNVKLANGSVGTPGIDIDGRIGDKIPSTITGTVETVKSNKGLGNRVIVTDDEGNQHFFNHLQGFNVKNGQTINKGDTLGTMGNSGNVIPGPGGDGSHLDYRVKSAKGWIDPNEFLMS